jgi:ribosomal protein S18 acetylase RimI-like enzyme
LRPGRSSDLPRLIELWQEDVRRGRRDCVRDDAYMRRVTATFDWEAKSRIAESASGLFDGAVLVSDRATPLGTVTTVDASAAGDQPEVLADLTRWGLGLSRAAGAIAAQVWRGRGHTDGLGGLGMEMVRPWWRMDRSLAGQTGKPSPVTGYRLAGVSDLSKGAVVDAHNRAFADHWRFSPRTEEELMAGRPSELSLIALAQDGSPAALTLCQVETYRMDQRPQPVGIISSVGTLPEHRRRGLAKWLVAEALVRLRDAGARHASLYVDALNPTRPFDAYRKLGFEVAFETEVWEAPFR